MEFTAVREVAEELGIDSQYIKVVKQLDEYSHDEIAEKYNVKKIVYLFLLDYVGSTLPELTPDSDHPAAKWRPLDQKLPFMLYHTKEHFYRKSWKPIMVLLLTFLNK